MSNTPVIAERYARALYNIEASQLVLDQLMAIQDAFNNIPQVFEFFGTPMLNYEQKEVIVAKIFEGCTENVLHFIQLLIRNKRIMFLKNIIPEYRRILLAEHGVELAQIVTATPVEEAFLQRFTTQIEALLNKKLEVQHRINKSIIGGVKIRIGSLVIDDSIENKLDMAKRDLLKRGVAQ